MLTSPTRILIATTNPGKQDEFRALVVEHCADWPVDWLMPDQVGLADLEVEETGDTFEANALIKAHAYAEASGLPALADDSGLIIDALEGRPGVYSARYAPTNAERIAKVLAELDGVPRDQRTAHFTCVIAIAWPNGNVISAEGHVNGTMATAPRGHYGHGYDPTFEWSNGQTFAELDMATKNRISHRARAFEALLPVLRDSLQISITANSNGHSDQ
jgi:XTP/dITP diphosphohydrolase